MSFPRFVYYSTVIGGWAALIAWWLAETFSLGSGPPGQLGTAATGGLVGALIAVGLNLVAGMGNAGWRRQLGRALPGLIVGGAGGPWGPGAAMPCSLRASCPGRQAGS